ncbi:MAG: Holliday junction branch migration protein RuvA [Paludibacteraceae bacterium]|nr:Holliday junction branch migration protein RuvA [Paludibacteraceae bacterium]MEE3482785.1 Holliday junction branch migration protein RuvA [Bacteroidales bacterium]
MFEYIKGKITDLSPTSAVIETNNIGFSINISLNTYTAIDGKNEALLYIYEAVREDAFTLYGFSSKEERALFLLLISVSGVGANSARMILSTYSVQELETIISTENVKQLKGVKGIGSKTAERIIVDLKDKVNKVGINESIFSPSNAIKEEALAALVVLGYNQSAANKVVDVILKENPSFTIEKTIKEALNRLR